MKNTLPELIARLGDEAAAELLKTEPSVAKSWRLRRRYPRREKAVEIIDILAKHPHGPMTFEGIYSD